MEIERRALYNSLRMTSQCDPSLKVEPWQVEDYRALPVDKIFDRLEAQDIVLDKVSFLALSDEYDTPEELTDDLVSDMDLPNDEQDKIYLLLFEIWRRFAPDKPCLSTFCDELDHQINLFDLQKAHPESIQDAIANLKVILDENIDNGVDPVEIFETISAGCANDVENFLYDFISEQIDMGNESFATELLEGFEEYLGDVKWFDFLRIRVLAFNDKELADTKIRALVRDLSLEPDLEFNLEALAFIVKSSDQSVFAAIVKKTIPLLETEEDFLDLLSLSAEFFRYLDRDHEEQLIQQIIDQRSTKTMNRGISKNDPAFSEIIKICESR